MSTIYMATVYYTVYMSAGSPWEVEGSISVLNPRVLFSEKFCNAPFPPPGELGSPVIP